MKKAPPTGMVPIKKGFRFSREGGYDYQNQGNWPSPIIASGCRCYQSPINIKISCSQSRPSTHIIMDYTPVESFHLSAPATKNFEVEPSNGTFGSVTVNDKIYDAINFHFHAPGEHQINSNVAELEMHVVHKFVGYSDDWSEDEDFTEISDTYSVNHVDEYVGIAVRFKLSTTGHAFLNSFVDTGLTPDGAITITNSNSSEPLFNIKSLFGGSGSKPIFYNYFGSLTVPFTNEVLNWFVLDRDLPITTTQLKAFTDIRSNPAVGNNRHIQGEGMVAPSRHNTDTSSSHGMIRDVTVASGTVM